jgi:hypothetical protein
MFFLFFRNLVQQTSVICLSRRWDVSVVGGMLALKKPSEWSL